MLIILQKNPEVELYVVGHTDSQGGFELNMDLSASRAEAVVDALVSDYGIDQKRLEAKGVAFLGNHLRILGNLIAEMN